VFGVGTAELLVIGLIALLVLGPDKLPEAARKVGRIITELRRVSSGFQSELRDALQEPMDGAPTVQGSPTPKAPRPPGHETDGEVPDRPVGRDDDAAQATSSPDDVPDPVAPGETGAAIDPSSDPLDAPSPSAGADADLPAETDRERGA
jgi:sec-independent protein translocase protein TatB